MVYLEVRMCIKLNGAKYEMKQQIKKYISDTHLKKYYLLRILIDTMY